MAHDPSKCNCYTIKCEHRKSKLKEDFETVYCNLDKKIIEFWGQDECPKLKEAK